jgi:hypothetical protein
MDLAVLVRDLGEVRINELTIVFLSCLHYT